MYLHTDTETTGIPINGVPSDDPRHPHIVSLTGILDKEATQIIDEMSVLIRPKGYRTEDFPEAFKIHGITTERAMDEGVDLPVAIGRYIDLARRAQTFSAYSAHFDFKLLKIACTRIPDGDKIRQELEALTSICTMESAAMALIGKKRMKLKDAYFELFHEEIQLGDHASYPDAMASRRIFWELRKRGDLIEPKTTARTYDSPAPEKNANGEYATAATHRGYRDTKIRPGTSQADLDAEPPLAPAKKRKPAAL